MSKKVALFDFCDTLISFQTGNNFIHFIREQSHSEKMRLKQKFLRFLQKTKLINLIQKFVKENYADKLLILWQLNGLKRDEIEMYARRYYQERLKPCIVPKVFDELKRLKSEGYAIYIISGGYETYIKYFVEDWDLDGVVASKILFKGNTCKGRLDGKDCMKAEKIKYLEKLFSENGFSREGSISYSDSASDLPLLKWTETGVVVSRQKSQQWAKAYNLKELIWD